MFTSNKKIFCAIAMQSLVFTTVFSSAYAMEAQLVDSSLQMNLQEVDAQELKDLNAIQAKRQRELKNQFEQTQKDTTTQINDYYGQKISDAKTYFENKRQELKEVQTHYEEEQREQKAHIDDEIQSMQQQLEQENQSFKNDFTQHQATTRAQINDQKRRDDEAFGESLDRMDASVKDFERASAQRLETIKKNDPQGLAAAQQQEAKLIADANKANDDRRFELLNEFKTRQQLREKQAQEYDQRLIDEHKKLDAQRQKQIEEFKSTQYKQIQDNLDGRREMIQSDMNELEARKKQEMEEIKHRQTQELEEAKAKFQKDWEDILAHDKKTSEDELMELKRRQAERRTQQNVEPKPVGNAGPMIQCPSQLEVSQSAISQTLFKLSPQSNVLTGHYNIGNTSWDSVIALKRLSKEASGLEASSELNFYQMKISILTQTNYNPTLVCEYSIATVDSNNNLLQQGGLTLRRMIELRPRTSNVTSQLILKGSWSKNGDFNVCSTNEKECVLMQVNNRTVGPKSFKQNDS